MEDSSSSSSSCALCEKRAMILCDSDQAKVCWECDEKVHSANFLVAKHSRVLLCRLCHSRTQWKASGTKLTPTLSFCHRCIADRHHKLVNNNNNNNVDDTSSTSLAFKRLRNNSFSVDSRDERTSSSSEMLAADDPIQDPPLKSEI